MGNCSQKGFRVKKILLLSLFIAFQFVHSMTSAQTYDERARGRNRYQSPIPRAVLPQSRPYNPSATGADPGSVGSVDSDCEGAYFAKLTLAAAAGSCEAIETAPNSPGGSGVCRNRMADSGTPAKKAEYSLASHQPEVTNGEIGAKNNATDCSGVPCQAWIAQGFRPDGKDLGAECPNSDAWVALADKGSQCLQPVNNQDEYKIGDLRCGGKRDGAKYGHCAFVCDQKNVESSSTSNLSPFSIARSLLTLAFPEIAQALGGGVKPTSDVTKLTLCEAVGQGKGWTLTPGTALLNTKLQGPGARTLRPVLRSEKPECYGEPKEVRNDDNVKQCKTLPKIAKAR